MRFTALLAILLTSVVLANGALATSEEARTITIQGNASVTAVPDAFSVTFVVEQQGETVSKLNQTVSESTSQIIKFLRSMGVEERHIQTMQVQLFPRYERINNRQQQSGFVLSRTIKVSHTQLDQYDALLDGALRNGANKIERFEFIVTNQERYYQQALVEAMQDAQQKAATLLKPIDAKVGQLLSVHEQHGAVRSYAPMLRAMEADMNTALPGSQGIGASITAIFTIE
jgi:uncharacterized protein YggE